MPVSKHEKFKLGHYQAVLQRDNGRRWTVRVRAGGSGYVSLTSSALSLLHNCCLRQRRLEILYSRGGTNPEFERH